MKQIIIGVVVLEYVTAILIMIATGFLADALRRFKKQSDNNKDLVLNHKLVYVHVSLVITQFVSSIVIWTILAYVSTTGRYVLINIVAVLDYFVMYVI